jgi:hypothetical protein
VAKPAAMILSGATTLERRRPPRAGLRKRAGAASGRRAASPICGSKIRPERAPCALATAGRPAGDEFRRAERAIDQGADHGSLRNQNAVQI